MSNLFVLGLGLATVFAGLICIIIICKLMSAICSRFDQNPTQPAVAAPAAAPVVSAEAPIPNRQELIAAVSAAIAEEAGTDISKIRILSVRRTTQPATRGSCCAAGTFIPNRQEFIAAVSAVIAEKMGADVSKFAFFLFKKFNNSIQRRGH